MTIDLIDCGSRFLLTLKSGWGIKFNRSEAQEVVDLLAEQGTRAEPQAAAVDIPPCVEALREAGEWLRQRAKAKKPDACVADTQGVGPEEVATQASRARRAGGDPLAIRYMVTEETAAAVRSRLPTYSEGDLEEVCSLSGVGFGPGNLLVLCDMLRVGGYRLAELAPRPSLAPELELAEKPETCSRCQYYQHGMCHFMPDSTHVGQQHWCGKFKRGKEGSKE